MPRIAFESAPHGYAPRVADRRTHEFIRSSEQLVVRHTRVGDTLTMHVSGVVDTITAPRLATHLEIALASGASLLIVDLTGVDFLASAGINLLIDVQRLTHDFETAMRVVADGPITARPLQVLGVDALLEVHPSVASARDRRD